MEDIVEEEEQRERDGERDREKGGREAGERERENPWNVMLVALFLKVANLLVYIIRRSSVELFSARVNKGLEQAKWERERLIHRLRGDA